MELSFPQVTSCGFDFRVARLPQECGVPAGRFKWWNLPLLRQLKALSFLLSSWSPHHALIVLERYYPGRLRRIDSGRPTSWLRPSFTRTLTQSTHPVTPRFFPQLHHAGDIRHRHCDSFHKALLASVLNHSLPSGSEAQDATADHD